MWQCYILWNQESYGLWKYGIKRQRSKSPVTVRTELQGLLFIFNVWEDTILKDEIKTLISLPFVKKKDNATSDYLNMLPHEEQKEGLRSPRLLELLELWNAVNLHFLSWWLSFFSHKCNNWDWHLRQGFEDKMTVLIKNY